MKPYDYDGSLDAAIKIHLRAALLGGDQDFVAALMATVNPTIIARFADEMCESLGSEVGIAEQQTIGRQVMMTYEKAFKQQSRTMAKRSRR